MSEYPVIVFDFKFLLCLHNFILNEKLAMK